MKQISFVLPSRENLKYLKWAYASIRKNANEKHWICLADDASTDGTWEWMQKIMETDKYVKAIRNPGPERQGHTILYDEIVEKLVETEIFIIFHADMYLTPGSIEKVLDIIKPKMVVSLTRIEPPLHMPGPEKLLKDFGVEPEIFREDDLLEYAQIQQQKHKGEKSNGMFAPWAIYREDFLAINGHDPLYAPQSREDSDIFNRFILAGYEPVQTWEAFVYHMTCRGSRYNPKLTFVGQESVEWLQHNRKSERNFARKWKSGIKHDTKLKPIISNVYDVGFIVHNCKLKTLDAIEPWANNVYVDCSDDDINEYIKNEQPNTIYDLKSRIKKFGAEKTNNILIKFDGSFLTQERLQYIPMFSDIIANSGEVGTFELDIFTFIIKDMKTYQNELIVCDKTKIVR